MKTQFKQHTACRICGSTNLSKYLDLGLLPLSNNLELTEQLAKDKERFPLQVLFCNNCGLSQLSVVIDPKELFSYYTYVSGINQGYVKHCYNMAKDLTERFGLNCNSFHIDIAGNDGTLLLEFQKFLKHKILNVDPAVNLTAIARERGVPSITTFWGLPVIYEIGKRADLITATNVFAHLDDLAEFMIACRGMLKDSSILVIENPYLIDFIDNMEFDTIYFEHVTYWSLLPMMRLCGQHHLKVIAAEKQAIHGGSMRYIIAREESEYTPSLDLEKICAEERRRGFDKYESYSNWAEKVSTFISDFRSNLLALKVQNKIIIGFAASAKGNTLLNSTQIDEKIVNCIIDETPEKIGKFYPGVGIPIVDIHNIMEITPDYILILSWNFQKEIIIKVRELGYKGKFIIPIPKWEIL
ncbi:MAG: class I SAM-dependent methyltransferase [Candidatus Paceibacterota bacterium]|jgi:hypothetical protein